MQNGKTDIEKQINNSIDNKNVISYNNSIVNDRVIFVNDDFV